MITSEPHDLVIFAIDEWFGNVRVSELAGGLVKTQVGGPSPEVPFPVGPWVGLTHLHVSQVLR